MKLNAGYLNTSFKKAMGVTLTQYIHSKKIERAKKMLTQTDESITDICADLGYFDQSHFYRRFKAETGVTPKKYRKNLGQ